MTKDNLELEQKSVQNLDRNFAQLFHFNFGCVLVNADIPWTPFHSIVRAPLYDLKLFPDPHGLVNKAYTCRYYYNFFQCFHIGLSLKLN